MTHRIRLAAATAAATLAVCCRLAAAGAAPQVPPEDLKRIEAAVPTKAPATPARPRKLLIFSRGAGHVHTAIPYGAKAFELMGAKTGAFEVVHSTDPEVFRPESLKRFDAICWNNSNRMDFFSDAGLRKSVIDFVRSGKGLVGVHAAATNFVPAYKLNWPEGGKLLGGVFDGHPWHEKVAIKLDDPAHPLNAAFEGKGFEIADEIYQFRGPYSRKKLRVLLSIDTTKTNMKKGRKIKRKDKDFAVSWVRSYGKGRVFYCSLGHDHPVFWTPAVLQHYLAGIQFALGDLPADTTPSAAAKAAPVKADAPDWPQFHGPRRDNISPDQGLLKRWPAGGPRLAWKFSGCGRGFAGVSIAGGLMFMSGDFQDKEMVIAVTPEGKLAWKTPNGASWRGPQPGARTTPTFHDGVVYHMNPTGRLAAFRAGTGKELWAVDLKQKFRATPGRWAMSENVIIAGDAVLCAPGGAKGRVVALDKATGKLLWANTAIEDGPAYCSPIVVTHGGVRQFITVMQKSVVSVDAAAGELLWTYPHETKNDQNVTMPIFRDGSVFVSSGHGTGGRLLRIAPDGGGVSQAWLNKDLDNCHGGVLLLGDYLYGSGCRIAGKGLVCVDFASGKTMWTAPALGKVSMTWADGLLYCIDDKGKVSLVKADEAGFKVVGRFQIPRRKRQLSLSHPVVFGGRLYIRYLNDLWVYDVRAASRT